MFLPSRNIKYDLIIRIGMVIASTGNRIRPKVLLVSFL